MKKTVCVLLSLVLLCVTLSPAALAAAQADEVYPTIIVAGYSSSNLYIDGEKIWKLDTNEILSAALSKIAQLGIGLGELAFRQPEYLVDVVGPEVLKLCSVLQCNPDGTSVQDIQTYYQDAEHTQFSYLYENLNGDNVHEEVLMSKIAEGYGENGNDYIFSYQNDFRMSMVDLAGVLDRYIDSVLEYTGAKKVNLFAVSHGGQTVAAYLAMYGREKNVVNNAVLTVPAIGGAALAYDAMSENVVFDEETLLYFIENGQMIEEDINWLVRANQFGILDEVCNSLIHKYVKQIIGYWGSIWDFIPMEYYEDLKNELLDPELSAPLIEKSDYFHYEILANMTEILNDCVDEGMNIYIMVGTGMPSVTGLQEQSDAIITVNSSTGADTAPYGVRFSDGYIQKHTVCTDPSHNHLSPDMTVDASTAYLPEYTWYVNGLYHGMTWRDDYCMSLCKTLLFSSSRADVRTYKEYPQFKYATNVNYSALAAFNSSPEGYISADDTSITVTNLSKKYKMRLISVAVDGADIRFDVPAFTYLEPQESVTLPIKGELPRQSLVTADVTVDYMLIGSVTPRGSRTMVFTVMNGDAPAYDANAPYAPALHETAFEKGMSDSTRAFLEKTGLFDLLKMIINSIITVIASLTSK